MPSGALFYADVNLDQGSSTPGSSSPRSASGSPAGSSSPTSSSTASNDARARPRRSLTFKDDIQPWLGGLGRRSAVTSLDASGGSANCVAFVASKRRRQGEGRRRPATARTGRRLQRLHPATLDKNGKDEIGGRRRRRAGGQRHADAARRDRRPRRQGRQPGRRRRRSATRWPALPADSLVRGYVNTQKIAAAGRPRRARRLAGGSAPAAQQLPRPCSRSTRWTRSRSRAWANARRLPRRCASTLKRRRRPEPRSQTGAVQR